MLVLERDHPPGSPGGERRHAALHARMSTLEDLSDQMDEGLRDVKEHVLPLLQQQDGFKGFIALGNPPEWRANRYHLGRASKLCRPARKSEITRSDTAEDTGDKIADVKRYEVGLFEMSTKS